MEFRPKSKEETKVDETNQPKVTTFDPSDETLKAKIKWLGQQLVSARPWIGRDDREYATVKTTDLAPNDQYNHPTELAEELLETFKNHSTYVTYKLRLGNKNADARLISVRKEERELVFALDTEYLISNAQGSLTQFASKKEPTVQDPATKADNIGF